MSQQTLRGICAPAFVRFWIQSDMRECAANVRFSNRPVWVKRFQAIHHCSVDVARGLVLLFGIGTRALPSWDSRTRWNNLSVGLAGRLIARANVLTREEPLNAGERGKVQGKNPKANYSIKIMTTQGVCRLDLNESH